MLRKFIHASLCTLAVALFAANARAHPASGIVVDAQGRIHFSDLETVWRLDAQGRLTVFRPGVSGRHVHELTIDAEGNVYGADVSYESQKWISAVWRRTPEGRETYLVAPTDNPPRGLSIWRDAEGNNYFVEQNNHTKRETLLLKRSPRGDVSTLAGGAYGHADGKGAQARFASVGGMTFGGDGSIYLSDGATLRRVSTDGTVRTLATKLDEKFADDTSVGYGGLFGLTVDGGGTTYVADYGNRRVLKITPDGKVSRALRAESLWSPTGVVATHDGKVLVLEVRFMPVDIYTGPRVRELSADGSVRVLTVVGPKAKTSARTTTAENATGCSARGIASKYETNFAKIGRGIDAYIGLGVIAIAALAGFKARARRSGHA